MGSLTENQVITITKEYIQKYNLHENHIYNIVSIKFKDYPTEFSDDWVWEVYFEAEGFDDLGQVFIVSDTERIVLLCKSIWSLGTGEVNVPRIKKKKSYPRERRLNRKSMKKDFSIDNYALNSTIPCIEIELDNIINDKIILLSSNSVKEDIFKNPILLLNNRDIIGYIKNKNKAGDRDDIIVFGKCIRNSSKEYLDIGWFLSFNNISLISEL